MAGDLGLDALTDDQLVELARELTAELCCRHPGALEAANDAIRAEVAASKAANERKWDREKWLMGLVSGLPEGEWQLSVWTRDGGRRSEARLERQGSNVGIEKWTMEITGGPGRPPGMLTCFRRGGCRPADTGLVRMLCREAARLYPGGRTVLSHAGHMPIPDDAPADYVARRAVVMAREEHQAAAYAQHPTTDEATAQYAARLGKAPGLRAVADVSRAMADYDMATGWTDE